MSSFKISQKGFTLIEVLIAMAILLIGALAIVPLFVFASETAETNNRRAIAANLANAEIEYIRSLGFTDVGFEDDEYLPGDLEPSTTKKINGVEYQIERYISWISEAADCTSEDPGGIEWDYKSVRVEVTVDAPKRPGAIKEAMETLVSRSVFEEVSPQNGIGICVFRGWKEANKDAVPVGGVKVTITGPNNSHSELWTSTNSNGAALFFLEKDKLGDYQVNVKPPEPMIVLPGRMPLKVTVPVDSWARERVFVEYPCFIKITLRDMASGSLINNRGNLVLWSPFHPDGEQKQFSSAPISEEVLGPLWPLGPGYTGEYSLIVKDVEGYHDTDWEEQKPLLDDGTIWEGIFSAPNTKLNLTILMVPIPTTPSGEGEVSAAEIGWIMGKGNSHNIIQKGTEVAADEDNNLQKVVFFILNKPEDMLTLNSGPTELTALEMYWEQGLKLDKEHLILKAELFKFNKPVVLGENGNNKGKLTLGVPNHNGSLSIDGSRIDGGIPGKRYGVVHFVDGLFEGDNTDNKSPRLKGAFYFPDGANLPGEIDSLIPWHKPN